MDHDEPDDATVLSWLCEAGLPVWTSEVPPSSSTPPCLEHVLVAGLRLAHHDAVVVKVFPVLLWKQRAHVDLDRLSEEATRAGEHFALGFFLELTGKLARDRRLLAAADKLRDPRRRRLRLFFSRRPGHHEMRFLRERTPSVARRWRYLMNMSFDTFESAFRKHTKAPAEPPLG